MSWGAIGGALIGGASSLFGGISRNKSSAKAAQKQMDFQERLSNTSHQREVKDLRAAGLNPILSAKLGGSSTPQGAMPNFINPAADASSSAAQLVSAANQTSQTQADVSLKTQQESKVIMDTIKVEYDIDVSQKQAVVLYETASKIRADTNLIIQKELEAHQSTGLKNAQKRATDYENVERKIMADFYETAEFAKIAKNMGVKPQMLKGIFASIFKIFK